MNETWEAAGRPPQHKQPGQWGSSPSLATVTARALSRCGVYQDNDPYETQWPEWANAAREDLIAALEPYFGGAPQNEIALSITEAGLYDLSNYGVLRIDRVGLGSGMDVTWLPWIHGSHAFLATNIPTSDTHWCGTGAYSAGGSVFGLAPIPTDTTVQVVVQGGFLPRPMINDTEGTGLPRDMLNLLVGRVAWYCCDFDRADVQREKRIPGLERDWERGLYALKLRYLQSKKGDAGLQTVFGVNKRDRMSGTRQMTNVSLVPHVPLLVPQPMLRLKSITENSVVGTTPLVFNLTVGYPVDADSLTAILVFSSEQGYIADFAVSDDRMTVTATPMAGQQFYGEAVTLVYGSTSV